MALYKEIELENGITMTYHRIVSLNKITNKVNAIEVASYINEKKRREEEEYYESEDPNKTMNVFIDTTYINKEYDEFETIEQAYDFLKTTDKFKDAKDI